jgi:hypothetical protein
MRVLSRKASRPVPRYMPGPGWGFLRSADTRTA